MSTRPLVAPILRLVTSMARLEHLTSALNATLSWPTLSFQPDLATFIETDRTPLAYTDSLKGDECNEHAHRNR